MFLEREVFPPFVKQKKRKNGPDLQGHEKSTIRLHRRRVPRRLGTKQAYRQLGDPLRSLKEAEHTNIATYVNVMPFAVSDAGTLGHAAKTLLSHIAGADPENNFAETYGRFVREVQLIVLEATARGAMASIMRST